MNGDAATSGNLCRVDAMSIFFEIHEGLARQAPGSEATTRHLLSQCGSLPTAPDVLDIGCGPGRASLVIADAVPDATIIAVDLHRPYLDQLTASACVAGVDDRIELRQASMTDLPFDDAAFDLVWSEGAISLMGFESGLRAWRRLVRPGGIVVVTEATWFTSSPSPAATAFWAEAYPSMTDVDRCCRLAVEAGYDVLTTYRLPYDDRWAEYDTPLTERLDAYDTTDPTVAAVVAVERAEIDLHRDHGDEYGYTGFVLRRRD